MSPPLFSRSKWKKNFSFWLDVTQTRSSNIDAIDFSHQRTNRKLNKVFTHSAHIFPYSNNNNNNNNIRTSSCSCMLNNLGVYMRLAKEKFFGSLLEFDFYLRWLFIQWLKSNLMRFALAEKEYVFLFVPLLHLRCFVITQQR